jgi:hypothetical protein
VELSWIKCEHLPTEINNIYKCIISEAYLTVDCSGIEWVEKITPGLEADAVSGGFYKEK